jgi:hypothetical protein
MSRSFLLTFLCLLVLAGCSGDGDDGETAAVDTSPSTTTAPAGTTTEPGFQSESTANAVMGQTLLRFVRAAGRGDAGAMWAELSVPTRASIGPTLGDFQEGRSSEFRQGLGTLADSARVVLSRQVGGQFGVAAIVGTRTVGGEEEEFAYGVALLNEDGKWKLELGGLIITGLLPEPLSVAKPDATIASNVGAAADITELHMWLDGKPLEVRNEGETPFTAELSATPSPPMAAGRHVAVTFAATSETATAIAWPFSVEP